MILYTQIFYQAGEELLHMMSLAKRRKERIEVLEDLLDHYRADFTASFNEVKRLRKVIQDDA